jgi:hypothetical protein
MVCQFDTAGFGNPFHALGKIDQRLLFTWQQSCRWRHRHAVDERELPRLRFVHDESVGRHIAKSLEALVEQHRDKAKTVEQGQEIDSAQEISNHRCLPSDRRAIGMDDDHPKSRLTRSGSLCQLEIDRIEPFQKEDSDEKYAGACCSQDTENKDQPDIEPDTDQAVDQPCGSAGNRAGRVEFEPDPFRCGFIA